MPEQDEDVTAEETEATESDGTGEQDGDGLGDKGRAALAKERQARKDAEKARRAAEKALADFQAQQSAGAEQDAAKAAAEQARRDAEAAALAKANGRILAAELKAAAKGVLADPSDAAAFIDLSQFEVGDDGSVDADEISGAISDLIKRKPHLAAKASGFQGTGDGGARANGSRARQVTDAELKTMTAAQIVKARQEGRMTSLLGG
jgi:hypothetical protein